MAQIDSTATAMQARSKALMVGFWSVFAIALIFALLVQFSMSAFQDLFQGFGVNLPPLTQLLLSYSKVLLILPAAFSVPAILYSEKAQLTKASQQGFKYQFIAVLTLLVLAIGLTLYAMYLPLIEMGKAV